MEPQDTKEAPDFEHECPNCGHVHHAQTAGGMFKCERCGEVFTGNPPEPRP